LEKTRSTTGITGIKLFQDLTPAGLSVLSRGLRHFDHKKGAPVLRKGQQVSGAYVVVSGQLRVFTITPDGNEATLYLINPGETCVLALNCIFSDLLYPAWVEASATTRVAVIPGPEYRILFECEPDIRNMTVRAFSTIVFRLMAELEDVHSSTLNRRLARLLLLQAANDGAVQMTQQEIASHLGTTREVVARSLRQLASVGHIETGRNRIVIRNPLDLAESMRNGDLNSIAENRSVTRSGRRRR